MPAGSGRVTVRVADRSLRLSNLDKVLYPEEGFTKAEVIDYYSRVAPVLLPHLDGRPLTVKRYPDGVDGPFFFEKNAPRHLPGWIRTATLPAPGSTKDRDTIDFAVIEHLPDLVYYANLAALELHVPMWRVSPQGQALAPDTLVFDLDPGPPATVVECCRVALLLREVLAEDGLTACPKTSGSKGMQLYAPWRRAGDSREYAREIARRLEAGHPGEIVSVMAKKAREGKVFIDWSQNNPAKTTVAPYSLRARSRPTVSTPLTWEEVEECDNPHELAFTASEVLTRVDDHGDLFGPVAH
ncbi:non-homologous end-joining DNA ligase [Spongiactinospora sp. TRM90649]|uniref:non-homologous end-joining DNA ligase n=1 Tax=Spongiactinospora sp. TRM90649 TaxID=3031114 RepID=UPI0023F77D2C|nr:non-homologous end-joining DNA ligase [Spongiactinospora sp. TRM90649]MDF5755494.1 non-homologous end-joining DNA ligase [Spongiactinospora sp. TRM90649]